MELDGDNCLHNMELKNPTELIKKLNNEISKTTSLNRTSAIKLNDNSVLNNFLANQLMSGIDPKNIDSRIKDISGESVKPEDIAKIFSKER